MAETVAQRRARLQKEIADLESAENAQMEKVLRRADERVRKAIDQAAEDIAKAANELDGESAVTADELRTKLYEQYNIKAEGEPPPEGEPAPEGEPPPEGEPAPEGEPPPEGEPAPEGEPPPEGEPAPPTKDEKPPLSHWASKPLFSRSK